MKPLAAIAIATAGLLNAAPAVFAFEETPFLFSPRPLAYTSFASAPANDIARHYAELYGNEPELTNPAEGGGAFEAHIQIERPAFVQEFSVFFTRRLCVPVDAGRFVSRCPARLIAYRGERPQVETFTNICIVHPADRPPTPADAGRTGAHASVRTGDAPELVLSAIVNGELIQQCSRSIPLGKSQQDDRK